MPFRDSTMAGLRHAIFILGGTLVALTAITIAPVGGADTDWPTLKKLRQNLTDSEKYDKNYQPLNSHSSDTIVNFTIYAKQLRYMEPSWSFVSISAFVCMHWIDEGLSWTPSDYDGMKEVTFGDSDVWTPTLSVHESFSVYGVRMFSSIKADYHGNVVWCPIVTFALRCTMELRDFPFDEHRCALNVSSWSHGYRIKLIESTILTRKRARELTPTPTTSHFNGLFKGDGELLAHAPSRMRGAGGVH
ncbi:neuronal acetylcholine receptor subunit beta-2 [Ixodes scapularis]